MARIPEAEIERLKREISLERLAEARGVKLRQHGKDLVGLCPSRWQAPRPSLPKHNASVMFPPAGRLRSAREASRCEAST